MNVTGKIPRIFLITSFFDTKYALSFLNSSSRELVINPFPAAIEKYSGCPIPFLSTISIEWIGLQTRENFISIIFKFKMVKFKYAFPRGRR
jgi:hypothetical protein